MPFLRAALIPHEKPEAKKTKKHAVCDEKIAVVVNQWLHEDDVSTARELALLGLA